MKKLITVGFIVGCVLSLSSAMATTAVYNAFIPPWNPEFDVRECPTVQELKSEYKGHLLTKKTEFNGLSLSVRNSSEGFNFHDLEAIGKNAYRLVGDYHIRHTRKQGILYMIVAADESREQFSAGYVMFGALYALSAGSFGAVPPTGSVDSLDNACSYQLSFLNNNLQEKYIMYARPR